MSAALSEPQRALLHSAATAPSVELFAPNAAVVRALRRRGLIAVRYIGQRWWAIRITELGRKRLAEQVQLSGSPMLTADTITDEQIRALRDTVMNGSPLAEACDIAVGDLVLDGTDVDVEQELAKERCAETINVRVGR